MSCYHDGMSDSFDENPYASPKGASEPIPAGDPDIGEIWRDGDELVFVRGKARPPTACWVTNRERFARRAPLVDDGPAVAIVLALFQVPAFGIMLSLAAAIVLSITGGMGGLPSNAWLTWQLSLKRTVVAAVAGVLFIVAFLLSNASIAFPPLFLLAVGATALQIYVYRARDRIVLGLEARRDGRRIVRVRGVHADYLKRLPPLPGTPAAEEEPGTSPFVESNQYTVPRQY